MDARPLVAGRQELYRCTLASVRRVGKKRPHTELNCSGDGPWITMHGDTGSVTINLREVMWGELFAASRERRRIISQWIQARDAEGEVSKIAAPDVPPGTRLGPRMKAKR